MPAGHINWVDRRFDFTFPVGLYPELIERLRGTSARLKDRLQSVAPELRTRRAGTDWSMQEHGGHLWDLEELVQKRLDNYAAGAVVLQAADMSNRKTWDANHNQRPMAEILVGFWNDREAIIDRLEALPPAAFARSALHPRLDVPMRLADMLFFQAEHDDYHLARISDLLRAFAAGTF